MPFVPGEDQNSSWLGRICWVFGSPRTGSTWLTRGLLASGDVQVWNEPLLGRIFFHTVNGRGQREYLRVHHSEYAFGEDNRGSWQGPVRRMLTELLLARFPRLMEPGFRLVIKEPNGSEGATALLEILPECRFLFLVRDPRDVIDSLLAFQPNPPDWISAAGLDPKATRRLHTHLLCEHWIRRMESCMEAFQRHPTERKLLVAYEELRRDTLGELGRVLNFLGLSRSREELENRVEAAALERVAPSQRGPGKAVRFGRSGQWRQTLDPELQGLVNERLGAWVRRLGYCGP